jgi:hypothetical protein
LLSPCHCVATAYTNTLTLSLAGGTIWDAAGNDATLTLPALGTAGSLGATKSLMIDTTAPSWGNLSPADNTTGVALATNLVITFNESAAAKRPRARAWNLFPSSVSGKGRPEYPWTLFVCLCADVGRAGEWHA